jgi:hypothetical protein
MKRLPTKKLTLNDKTVRTLTESHLRAVVGGVGKDGGHDPSDPPELCGGSAAAGSAGCGGKGGGTGTGK